MTTRHDSHESVADADSSIRAAVACPGGGTIVTMGFPGLNVGFDGTSYLDPQILALTLDHLERAGVSCLIALAERQEFPSEHWDGLNAALAQRSIELDHLPIEDFAAPDARFLQAWANNKTRYHAILDQGGVLGITCHYGAGRSGTIAAHIMIERGVAPREAIERIREAFPESIESQVQYDWLFLAE